MNNLTSIRTEIRRKKIQVLPPVVLSPLDMRILEAKTEKKQGGLKTVNAQNIWESIL